MASNGGLSLHQQKKLFRAIEEAGGLFKVKNISKKVFDADPAFFGGPSTEHRRKFQNRVQVVKRPNNPDANAYYTLLKELGVEPNLTGEPRATTGSVSDSESSSSSSSLAPPISSPFAPPSSSSLAPQSLWSPALTSSALASPALTSPAPEARHSWSSPQLLPSTLNQPTSSFFLHSATPQLLSAQAMNNDGALVSRFANMDMSNARFDFNMDESVDSDTRQRIRSKCLVSRVAWPRLTPHSSSSFAAKSE
jgi:hypothetical protein